MKLPRMRLPLASRISLTFSLLILVIFTGSALVTERHLSRSMREQAELRLASFARSLAALCVPSLMAYDYVTLQQVADDALQEPALVGVTVLDKEGLIAGCGGRRELVGQKAKDPIGLRAVVAPEACLFEERREGAPHTLEWVQPVVGVDGTRWGTVRVGLSLEGLERKVSETRGIIVIMAFLGALMAFVIAHRLARRITHPLALLVQKANDLGEGGWSAAPEIRTGDEIEVLAEQFAAAAKGLDRQKRELIRARDDLAALNATLEQKVRDRTAELVESQEKYRLLVEAAPDPLCLIRKGRFRFVNRAFCETFGYTEEQVTADGFGIERLVHPDFVRVVGEILDSAEKRGEQVDTDCVAIGRGGRTLDFNLRGRCVTYQGTPVVEILWLDLTNQKRILRQMVQSERLRGIGEMTTMVAHNFNNLLAVILGRTQLLQARTDDGAVAKGLEIIRTAALQGSEIVKRIQDYSGEAADLQFREVNVATVVRDVVAYMENVWKVTRTPGTGRIQVEVTAEPSPLVHGSETLLAEIFKHILANAAESMPKGGRIRVTVSLQGESVRVSVQDSGVGMTAEVIRRAFDPFYTTKGSRARGLGLSVSYGLVQRHRGRIDLSPIDTGGTRVDVLMPALRSGQKHGRPHDDSPAVFLTAEQEAARQIRRSLRTRSASRRGDGGAKQDGETAAA